MSSDISFKVFDKLVQIFSLLFVWYCRIVQTQSQTFHRSILQMSPEEMGYEKCEPLEQKQEADPLVVRLEDQVIFLLLCVVRADTGELVDHVVVLDVGGGDDEGRVYVAVSVKHGG